MPSRFLVVAAGVECEYGSDPNPTCSEIATCQTNGWTISTPSPNCSGGPVLIRSTSTSELRRSTLMPTIKPIGVRYWLPPGQSSGVAEPAQMYFVVPTAGGQR